MPTNNFPKLQMKWIKGVGGGRGRRGASLASTTATPQPTITNNNNNKTTTSVFVGLDIHFSPSLVFCHYVVKNNTE
jgi:hypothetical protein